MTNEELVTAIRQGRSDYLELWEQTKPFIAQQAARLLRSYGGYIPGVGIDDLIQSGYFALIAAVESFDESRGKSFIGWLALSLKVTFAETCGYRTSRREPLNAAISLDAPIGDEPDAPSLIDLLPDPSDAVTDAEEEIYLEQLHAALEKAINTLPPQAAAVIRGYFWNSQTLEAIGQQQGISTARTAQIKNDALSRLRRESRKRDAALSGFIESRTPYYKRVTVQEFQRTGTSAVESLVIFREDLEKREARKIC